jgi:hypothetical protein
MERQAAFCWRGGGVAHSAAATRALGGFWAPPALPACASGAAAPHSPVAPLIWLGGASEQGKSA